MVSTTVKKRYKEKIRQLKGIHSHCPKERGPSKADLRKIAEEALKTGRVAAPTPKHTR